MRNFSLNFIALSLGMALTFQAQAAVSAQQQLLEQVRIGEATNRDDLVRQSLYRLELIAPDDPQVVAAKMRYELRRGDSSAAKKDLERLAQLSPGSDLYYQAVNSMALASSAGRQQLQEARLLAAAGKTSEAIAAYKKLFNGHPPQGDMAVEYWSVVSSEPAQRNQAIKALSALNQQYPSTQLRSKLAQLLLANGHREEGFKVLEQMARSRDGRSEASGLWYDQIASLPPSSSAVQALQRYLAIFTDGDNADKARSQLADMQHKLADPAFRQRANALAEVNSGDAARALPALQKAAAQPQSDGEVMGALGEAWSQKGNRARAVQSFEQALRLEPKGPNSDRWKGLLAMNRYWLLIQQGDDALKAQNTDLAQRKYQQARNTDNTDSYAVLGLGDVAVARKDDALAERYYQQALRMDRGNSNAVRGLANIYRRQSPEKASAFLNSLSAAQRRSVDDIERSLRDEQLADRAQALEEQGQWNQAAELHRQRLAMDPESVWITYRLAKDLYAAGRHEEADALFRNLARRRPDDPEQVYAMGLYLSANDQDNAALAHLDTLPRNQWTDNIHELANRLNTNKVMADANRLRDSGQEKQAVALLEQQTPSARISLTLAEWAAARGDRAEAQHRYESLIQQEPDNLDARLGLAELFISEGEKTAAHQQITAVEQAKETAPLSLNTQRRLAGALNATDETAKANALWKKIIPEAKALPPSMESALVLRDAARAQAKNGEPGQALDTWRDAMVAADITPVRPVDNDTFTRLTRNNASDDWLKRGVRSDAADLYRQQDVNVSLDYDYWGSSGTPGYSDLTAHTTMLQVDAPLSDGRMLFRTDMVHMDAGSFQTDANGNYDPRWGTCDARNSHSDSYQGSLMPCSGSRNQTATGVSVAVGWRNDTWAMDLGTTPMGFPVVDVVGSLSYSNKVGVIGYTVDAHRRPVSSSLLAFAGQTDAKNTVDSNDGKHTGVTWGGVRANGGGVSLSYDQGKANGVWSSLSADQLTGKNVADNWRVRWMTGYYYKLINEDNRRVTVGLTNMLWHYDKDLSAYTLGQGGYYSPQKYVSFALPVTWRQRTENWSWELGGSVSWSHSQSNSQRRYPISGLIPDYYADKYDDISGGSSNGVGYTARAIIERRLTSHWSLGLGIDIQEAKDYTPSHAMLFARYSLAGWQGDMNMPPQPLVPYADW